MEQVGQRGEVEGVEKEGFFVVCEVAVGRRVKRDSMVCWGGGLEGGGGRGGEGKVRFSLEWWCLEMVW